MLHDNMSTLMRDRAVTVSVAHSTLLSNRTSERLSSLPKRRLLMKVMQADRTMKVNMVPRIPKKLIIPKF